MIGINARRGDHMIGIKQLTKSDLIQLIEENFSNTRLHETVAVMTTVENDGCVQQCILLTKEVDESQ